MIIYDGLAIFGGEVESIMLEVFSTCMNTVMAF